MSIIDCAAHRSLESTNVALEGADCIDAAYHFARCGAKVLLLVNSAHNLGGGVESGSSCQEEETWRRTNIGQIRALQLAPLGRRQFALTEEVTILRGGEAIGYPFLPAQDRRQIDVMSIPAINLHRRNWVAHEPTGEQIDEMYDLVMQIVGRSMMYDVLRWLRQLRMGS